MALGACLSTFYWAWVWYIVPIRWNDHADVEGIVETVPVFADRPVGTELDGYVAEFAAAPRWDDPSSLWPGKVRAGFDDLVVYDDAAPQCEARIVVTDEGSSETAVQRVHVRTSADAPWTLLELPSPYIYPRLIVVGGEPCAMFVCQRAFDPSLLAPARRLLGLYEPALGPGPAIFLAHLDDHELEYLFPGSWLDVSPDRRHVVIQRDPNGSGSTGTWLASLHIWDPATRELRDLVSVALIDHGSDNHYSHAWSADSKALFIDAYCIGFSLSGEPERDFSALYFAERNEMFDISERMSNLR